MSLLRSSRFLLDWLKPWCEHLHNLHEWACATSEHWHNVESASRGNRPHQLGMFMYLDGQADHKLLLPRSKDGLISRLPQCAPFHMKPPWRLDFSMPGSSWALVGMGSHLHPLACIECRDDLVIHSHHRPMSKVYLRRSMLRCVRHHMQFELSWHFKATQLILELVGKGSPRHLLVDLSWIEVLTARMRWRPKSKHYLWCPQRLYGHRLLRFGKFLYFLIIWSREDKVRKDTLLYLWAFL